MLQSDRAKQIPLYGDFGLAEPSQFGRSEAGMHFVFNKGTAKVSTTF
jgi:hypothetical protein